MGKSYKKFPSIKNSKSSKAGKRTANRSIRHKLNHGEDIGNGNQYKKHFESYNVDDYKVMWTLEDAINHYKLEQIWAEQYGENSLAGDFIKQYPTLKDWIHYWKKIAKRK